MGIECSWTFWKGKNKIFNLYVGQKFIWSLYDDVILRIKKFLFLAVEITGPLSISGNFLFDLIFFHDEVGHDIWGLYKHEWAPSNQFYSSNHWLNQQLTKFDFSRVLGDWTTSDEFQTLIPWELDFKWCPKMYELLIIDHDAQIPQEWPSSIALTDQWLSLT